MRQTESVVRLIEDVLGADLIGAYLHGSSVLGGLHPASDLDVLAVSHRAMDDTQRRALIDELRKGIGPRPVELSVVVQSEVCPWRYPPVRDLLYGDWLRDEFASGTMPQPEPASDLALLITVAVAGDRPLIGPPPAEVFDPIPHADVVDASVAHIPGLLVDLPTDTRNVLLTLARIWTTLATGAIRPKDAAVDWVLPHLAPEHRPVLEHARDLYLHHAYADDAWDDQLSAGLRPSVDAMLAEIQSLSARSTS
jgi:streptomycin 3"-adenylyltransferase